MRRAVIIVCALSWLHYALAGDKPEIGPVPSWVVPVAVPADDGTGKDAAVKFLLSDWQDNFSADAAEAYFHTVLRVQTPQGLNSVGTIALPWNPATDSLTIHYLHLLRGTQTVDVLAGGQTFTVLRRENSLEYAALNGVLTAVIQPPGLQVDDEIDLAFTLARSNPVLAGESEFIATGWPGMPIGRMSFQARWTGPTTVRWWASDVMPKLHETRHGDTTMVSFELDNPVPPVAPNGAPARFRIGRQLQFSSFKSWQQVSARLGPLYEQAAKLGAQSPLQAEVERIRTTAADPGAQALAALALVQDQVRYVFLGMNEGALVPTDADLTWSRRFGDCKGKTALLLALLHQLGIEAEPVAVNVLSGDAVKSGLPMIEAFNHVIVRATVQGQTYWLDGARSGDRQLADLAAPPYHWGLPLTSKGSDLTAIVTSPPALPLQEQTISIDASGGIPGRAPIHGELVFRGQEAALMRFSFGSAAGQERERLLKTVWNKAFTNLTIDRVEARFDEPTGCEYLTMEGSLALEWREERLELEGLQFKYNLDFERSAGPNSEAPYAVPFPSYSHLIETIQLPRTQEPFTVVGEDIQRTIGGVEFKREARVQGNVLTAEASERVVTTEIAYSVAMEAKQTLSQVRDAMLYLHAPAGYVALPKAAGKPSPDQPLESLLTLNPSQMANQLIDQGNELLDKREYDQAIGKYEQALLLEPRSAWALADRGLARYWKNESALAREDFDAAAVIDPHNPVAQRGRGLLALEADNPSEAIVEFNESLRQKPDHVFTLQWRAEAYRRSGDSDKALDDNATVIRLQPHHLPAYGFRAMLLRQQGRQAEAVQQGEAVIAANAGDTNAYLTAAAIYVGSGEEAQAMNSLDRALALAPTAQMYVIRAGYRPKADLHGREVDAKAALRLDARYVPAIVELARVQTDAGNYREAEKRLTTAIATLGELPELVINRGIVYAKSAQPERAERDFAAARTASSAPMLNRMCWWLATSGVALDTALAACDAALEQQPGVRAFEDSRGMALLRLGRYDEAIVSYDEALKSGGDQSISLYGRGLAKRRNRDLAAGDADIEAARQLDAHIATTFADFGLTP